jgi:hypothetical protein
VHARVDRELDVVRRIGGLQAACHRDRGIVRRRDAEHQLKMPMSLLAEGSQVVVQTRLGAAQRFEHADADLLEWIGPLR